MCECMNKNYNPKEVEDKIYENWEKSGYFSASVDENKKPYSVIMPPPNVTGNLHMGHALDQTMQDILIRFKRMQGYSALWIPGTDHASIATEAKVVQELEKEGLSKEKIGREEFLKRAWQWKEKYGGNIKKQLRKLGISCDWARERFTMDEGCSEAVKEYFLRLYEKGLIYRGERIINWCPNCKTSISDAEVEFKEQDSHFWHLKYYLVGSEEYLEVATTRPETIFGDVAVAVNPNDERYKKFVGREVTIPLVGRKIPVIADDYVDIEVGTGVLKITPAHDPNDFEVGARHNLPIIKVMDEKAFMNEKAGEYAGLERFEARKKLVKELEALGFIAKIEDIKHNVGTCYRCQTTIEPSVSMQWFVKMKPLAEMAIKSLKEKETVFVPERFTKIYYHWMENIKDWCISRQLWWGHRIPAWYCDDCGEIVVSKEEILKCPKCGSSKLTPESDTLDTWFSSGLWPFSTLGWPEKTPELDYFFPASTLVTGHDLIFFWIARMIVASDVMMGRSPFERVLIHGLVRDSQGRKMSKSLGNGIDPLEIIDSYGADALRFSLMLGNSPGNDLRFYTEKVESSRNFANKIWNAARFIHMKAENKEKPESFTLADRWILSRLNRVINEVITNLDNLDLGLAAQKLYDFVWNEFCDWYIEFSKLSSEGYVLLHVIKNILKLIHPFMPFITEEIWKSFDFSNESIMISKYPEFDEALIDEKAEKEIQILMTVIKSIRNMRREMNVPQNKRPLVYLEVTDDEIKNILEQSKEAICKLSFAGNIEISSSVQKEKCASAVNEYAKIYIPLGELVDKNAEIARLTKELENAKKQLEGTSKRLLDENFTSKAPEKVINGAKEMKASLENKVQNLLNSISELREI